MKTVSAEFEANANQTGNMQFRMISQGTRKDGKHVYIFQRTYADGPHLGKVFGYEVFIPTITKAGTVQKFPNGTTRTVEEDTENYPGASLFGVSAYFCVNMERANKRYSELMGEIETLPEGDVAVEKENSETAVEPKHRGRKPSHETLNFPDGEFSTQSLANFNNVEYHVVANFMKKHPDKFKLTKEERVGNAKRPTKFFVRT